MQRKPLTVFMLAMMNVAALCSIKNWPITAEFGYTSLFFYLAGTLCFFIPCAFVAAELASAFSVKGGVFTWVKEALGHQFGFLAIWLQWVENIFYYPTVLSFAAATIAYTIDPSLASSPTFAFCVITVGFWGLTWLNTRGIGTSGWFSTLCTILGTIIPGVLIISLGLNWWSAGRPLQIDVSVKALIPQVHSLSELSLLAGMLLSFAGIEMTAVHVTDVRNSKKNYPRAIALSAIVIVILSVLGTLSIAFVIPHNQISLVASGMQAIAYFLEQHRLAVTIPLFAFLIALGALGTVNTWMIGPARGLLAAADNGELPPFFHMKNKQGMPIAMLLVQAFIVTAVSLLFLYFKDVSRSFWILIVLASQLYILMYILMFITGILLRYKKPHIERPYRVPGGNWGMWTVGILGILTCLFGFIVGFVPPQSLGQQNTTFFILFLATGLILFTATPFCILAFRKASWKIKE